VSDDWVVFTVTVGTYITALWGGLWWKLRRR
jgi:hypothetical protein